MKIPTMGLSGYLQSASLPAHNQITVSQFIRMGLGISAEKSRNMCAYGKETGKLQGNVAEHKNICYTVRAERKSLCVFCLPVPENV